MSEVRLQQVNVGEDRIAVHSYPEPDSHSPVVVVWPAMGVPAGYYRRLAGALSEAGLAPVVVDLRGTGASIPRPSRRSRYGYPELVADVEAVAQALKDRLDGRRVLLLGHSLGGQLCALHLAVRPDSPVDGLVLVAVGLPYWRVYENRQRLWVLPLTQSINVGSALLGVWPGWGFGGRQSRGVIRDWARTARVGRFPRLGGADVENLLAHVRTPVLAVSVDDDHYTPPSTTDHLCAKLVAAPVERVRYTAGEAGAELDHFRWVRAAGPLAHRIATFAAGLPER